MKRTLALICALILLLTSAASALTLSEPGTLPLVTEEATITIGLPMQPDCTDYYDNEFTQMVEEMTGVTLSFDLLPSDGSEAKQKISLMISANQKLPDILNVGLSDSEISAYGAAGVFVPLNDYLENEAVFFHEACDKWLTEQEYANMMNYGKALDGNIYGMPSYSTTIDSASALGMWINKNWLDKLGLEVPKTTEDLYNVLVAFRDGDPNGNGLKDEIPLVGATGWVGNVVQELLNSYLYYCYTGAYGYQLNAQDGQLIVPFTQDAFREGVQYVAKLYAEGLISPLSFTQSTAELRAIMTAPNDEATLVGAFVSHPSPVFGATGDVERVKEYIALPAMIGPEGVAYTAHEASLPTYSLFITKDSAEPELAFRLMDAFREETLNLSSRFGQEGKDWYYTTEGNIPVKMEGYSARFGKLTERPDPWSSASNIIWGTTAFSFLPNKLCGSMTIPEWPSELRAYQMQTLWYDSVPLRSGKCPEERPLKILLNDEETDRIAEIRNSIQTYVDDSTTRFVTGDLSAEKDWDSYLSTLQSIGLEEYMSTLQTAYDRMNGK